MSDETECPGGPLSPGVPGEISLRRSERAAQVSKDPETGQAQVSTRTQRPGSKMYAVGDLQGSRWVRERIKNILACDLNKAGSPKTNLGGVWFWCLDGGARLKRILALFKWKEQVKIPGGVEACVWRSWEVWESLPSRRRWWQNEDRDRAVTPVQAVKSQTSTKGKDTGPEKTKVCYYGASNTTVS